jgi:hypothetical protein
MRKWFVALMTVVALGVAGLTMAAVEKGEIKLKAGDEVYVCGCGAACPCETISRKAGKCSCNKDLVEAKVTKVEEGKVVVMVNGKEQAFKTTGKFQCACGPKCNCDTISQKPGKCACGKELEEVK